ncbi:ion transporter [Dyella psychrodurans]|uniref:Ion transporter n=1 Tax=Dyella psychrodurans TaxID=1927960 RepID=A0A370WWV0_9GAMM|nr:ion transporter [Dyella psychrodurans]RDS80604.1 ion transporter [Dyella psychrodurans]
MPTRPPFADELGPATQTGWRARWFHIIFGHEDAAGRRFDVLLIIAILGSIAVAVFDTVAEAHARYGAIFYALEWLFTLAFTLEYITRIAVVDRPWRYIRSFYGIVDVLAVVPTWISLVAVGSQYLLVVRALRILRIFRILKLTRYVGEADLLWLTLVRARRKVLIFFSTILTLVLIFGALMYLIEGPEDGFTSIPTSMYWAIVTMTTVGFGDITPKTTLGKLLTSLIILIGYSIIAVPTGIFTAELAAGMRAKRKYASCTHCGQADHDGDAVYCRICGAALPAKND